MSLSLILGMAVSFGWLAPATSATRFFIPDGCSTLAAAITAANEQSDAGGACVVAARGAVTIVLTADVTLTVALPAITSAITINANGHTIERDPRLFFTDMGGDGNDPCSSGDVANKFRVFHVQASGRLDLNDATVRYGCGNPGGGILVEDGTLTVASSTVTRNSSRTGLTRSKGGGIATSGVATVVIRASAILDNEANGRQEENRTLLITTAHGGGIHVDGGTLDLTDSTVADNQANGVTGGGGGAIQVAVGALTVTSSTIARNTSAESGAAGGGILTSGGTASLTNTLLANNKRGRFNENCAGSISALGHNLSTDGTCFSASATLGNQVVADAKLGAFADDGTPGNGHYPLLADSPAIDAGDDTHCGGTDQIGQTRVDVPGVGTAGTKCDIGAIEFPTVPVCPTTFDVEFSGTEYAECFRDVLRPTEINDGVDLGATSHTSLNFTGSTGATASTWLTLYDDTPDTAAAGPTFGAQTVCADVLIERFNNTKGAGLVTLFNEGVGQQGLAAIVYDAGNTDTLALATVDGNPANKGKLVNLRTQSLAGKIATKAWYRLVVTVNPGAPSVTASVRAHAVPGDPNSALSAQLGALTYTPTALPAGVASMGQVGLIATAVNAVVNASITNFSNDPTVCTP